VQERTDSGRPARRRWRWLPSRRALAALLAIAIGLLAGLGGFTFRYAEGFSYFSADPAACVNCHIMQSQLNSWQRSSHRSHAVCIECHLPHDFISKYIAKAENGYRHGKEFTAQTFAEPIFVQERGSEILQENCVRCHEGLVAEMGPSHGPDDESLRCVHCHAGVGHGEAARLGGRYRAHEIGRSEP
jgi:cytochrome c nitrite reductase small subunit